jgi:hypothetical protein
MVLKGCAVIEVPFPMRATTTSLLRVSHEKRSNLARILLLDEHPLKGTFSLDCVRKCPLLFSSPAYAAPAFSPFWNLARFW